MLAEIGLAITAGFLTLAAAASLVGRVLGWNTSRDRRR